MLRFSYLSQPCVQRWRSQWNKTLDSISFHGAPKTFTTESDPPKEPLASTPQREKTSTDQSETAVNTDDGWVDADLQKAALKAQETVDDAEDAEAPYKSDFPLRSPTAQKENTLQSQTERIQFLRSLVGKAESAEGTQGKSSEDKDTAVDGQESLTDADTGFAELGGYTQEVTTGLLDEQPLKLHPIRFFFPGDQYNPEELHPLGIAREDRFRRRRRTILRTYDEQDVKAKMDFKNLAFLNNFLSDSGLILSRRETRLSKQLQTRLERSVKLAQSLALLPVLDRRREFKRKPGRATARDVFT